jgi:hypothetical protein
MHVANEILAQLGGNRFVAMTGAKNFTGTENSLHFALPARFAKDGINRVVVALDPSDTYTVTFYRARGTSLKTIATDAMVYCDTLRATFTERTGLLCTL